MHRLSHLSLYPVDGPTLLQESGTFWSRFAQDTEQVKAILELLAWLEADRYGDIAQVRSRWSLAMSGDRTYRVRTSGSLVVRKLGSQWRGKLPDRMLTAAAIRLSNGGYLEYGRDYTVEAGEIVTSKLSYEGVVPATFYNVETLTGDLSRFWCDIAKIADATDDIADLLRVFFRLSGNVASESHFKDLIAAITQCPKPTVTQLVEDVVTIGERTIIYGSEEALVGPDGSTSLVSAGETIQPQQDIFDAVRYWDASTPPPAWVSSLKVPARFFAPIVKEPLEFVNTPQSVSVTVVDGKPRVTFPITGSSQAVGDFFRFVRKQEDLLQVTLAEAITGETSPALSQIPATVNPLQILHSLWLANGVTVSVLRLEPTVELLTRLQLLRRAMPPWQGHIIHFEQPVPDAMSSLC